MIGTALIIIVFAITCCVLALWVIVGDHDIRGPRETRPDPLAGMTPAALDLVRQANRSRG